MKIRKSSYLLPLILLPIFIVGCAGNRSLFGIAPNKPDLSKHLVVMNYEKYFGTKPETKLSMATEDLPKMLQEDPLIEKITTAVKESLEKGEITKVHITKADLKNNLNMFVDNFGVRATNVDELTSQNKFIKRIKKYLWMYFTDEKGFIDREGTVYKPPKIQDGIGSDVIGPTVAVLFEAIWDGVFPDMPVFFDEKNQKWMTRTGLPPTAFTHGGAQKKAIEKYKLDFIWYLSGLTSEQSKHLSGMVYRLLGDVQLGAVVIAGHFSIGDNDTLARMLDEVIKVTVKRAVEYTSYKGVTATTGVKAGTPAARLLADLEELNARKMKR